MPTAEGQGQGQSRAAALHACRQPAWGHEQWGDVGAQVSGAGTAVGSMAAVGRVVVCRSGTAVDRGEQSLLVFCMKGSSGSRQRAWGYGGARPPCLGCIITSGLQGDCWRE
eukprot:scaffold86962_cov19-Tisochrysis_lutea.AAC.1